jgi:hypothetical protein
VTVTVEHLTAGLSVELDDGRSVTVERPTQRAWSRVATGRLDGRSVFIKQFVDRTGTAHDVGYDGELATAADLTRPGSLPPGVLAIPVLATSRQHLVTVSPLIEMQTWDTEAGRGTAERRAHAAALGSTLNAVLRHRSDSDRSRIWKGLEAKNIGVLSGPDGPCGCCAVFDLGPSVHTLTAEAGARMTAYAFTAPLARNLNLDALLGRRSAVRNVVRPLTWSTDRARVEAALARLLAHRSDVAPGSNRLFAALHQRYQTRALTVWSKLDAKAAADGNARQSPPPSPCPHHLDILSGGSP